MLTIHIDGAARGNPGPAGIGVIAKDGHNKIFEMAEYIGEATNNVAEYSALIRGLEEVLLRGFKEAHFISDSELIVKQLNGQYKVKDKNLQRLYHHAQTLISKMRGFSIKHVRREHNKEADELANRGIDEK